MGKLWKTAAIAASVALTVTACGSGVGMKGINDGRVTQRGNTGTADRLPDDGPLLNRDQMGRYSPYAVEPLQQGGAVKQLSTPSGERTVTIPFVEEEGEKYVSVDKIVELLQFEHYIKKGNIRKIGDKDIVIQLEAGSLNALKEGEPFRLAKAPKIKNGEMIISAAAAVDLFAEEMVYEVNDEGLVLFPSDSDVFLRDTDDTDHEQVDPSLDFGDDPDDPFKGEDAEGAFDSFGEAEMALDALEAIAKDPEAVPALKNVDVNELIRTAKRYLGVPYDFGAAPYPQSNRFDCSSYTQYVFAKHGIELPRTAREQMKMGETVSRKSLRKGDLLFFYVPGRFKSNKVAGHVGIYIGNRMMIHANTEPKDGVQIRSIDRPFWKKTFLKAKRIVY